MNFLGQVGLADPQMNNPFAGSTELPPLPDGSAEIQRALQHNQQLGQQQTQQKKSGFGDTLRNVLGTIGDALLMNAGQKPVYGPMKQRRRASAALANYLGNTDAALAEMVENGVDLGDAVNLYKIRHQQPEVTADQRNFDYYQGLDPAKRAAYENYLRLTHPGMMSPISMGANDTIEMPGQPAADSAPTATGPNGEKVRFNQQTGAWEPMQGGPTAPPSGDFL